MVATTMLSMTLLFNQLKSDHPGFTFKKSAEFWWSASSNTVHLNTKSPESPAFSLHELSHAILGHQGYTYDVDLIKIERDAWQYAVSELASKYGVTIDDKLIQDNLDTYREWLHARSRCPSCEATGLQSKDRFYRCLGCGTSWHANEARICSLRRYTRQTK